MSSAFGLGEPASVSCHSSTIHRRVLFTADTHTILANLETGLRHTSLFTVVRILKVWFAIVNHPTAHNCTHYRILPMPFMWTRLHCTMCWNECVRIYYHRSTFNTHSCCGHYFIPQGHACCDSSCYVGSSCGSVVPLFIFLVSVFAVEFSPECSAIVSPFIVHSVQRTHVYNLKLLPWRLLPAVEMMSWWRKSLYWNSVTAN